MDFARHFGPAMTEKFKIFEKYLIELIHLAANNLPAIEKLLWQAIEFGFGPKQIFYHFLFVGGLQVGTMVIDKITSITSYCLLLLTTKGRMQIQFTSDMEKAESYEVWKQTAEALDRLRGIDEWKRVDKSSLYDYKVLKKRIADTKQMIREGDIFNLIFRLRGALARDQFGVLHEALYSKATCGTKTIVESYLDTVSNALNFIVDSPISDDEVTSLCCNVRM